MPRVSRRPQLDAGPKVQKPAADPAGSGRCPTSVTCRFLMAEKSMNVGATDVGGLV